MATTADSPSTTAAEEGRPDKILKGYQWLARYMCTLDHSACFRKFEELFCQALFDCQEELIGLENRFHRRQAANQENGSGTNDGQRDRKAFSELEIKKLTEYASMVVLFSTLQSLPKPNGYDLSRLQDGLDNEKLKWVNGNIWGTKENREQVASDLACTKRRTFQGPVTRVLCEKVIPFIVQWCGLVATKVDDSLGIVTTEDEAANTFTYVLSAVVASLLQYLPVVILYCIGSMGKRIAVLGVFTVVFTFAVAVFTSASPTEIFAVTAAFLAVQKDNLTCRDLVENSLRTPINFFDNYDPHPGTTQLGSTPLGVCGQIKLTYYVEKPPVCRPQLFVKAQTHTDIFLVSESWDLPFIVAIGKHSINKHGFTMMNGPRDVTEKAREREERRMRKKGSTSRHLDVVFAGLTDIRFRLEEQQG
ncbi:hypothetical protein NA57DRAFT_75106 [Rhizodiscina lignyota]|uniref:DUF6594 domain-containing protein n=1 Tax=Rhizodiscina lignyota TaxID=1504668 RepID=A0A9P4ID09_9PEZI|nr:hypothetical protein NA57DRAFT_75106 [Rhizodiscina lignyota]